MSHNIKRFAHSRQYEYLVILPDHLKRLTEYEKFEHQCSQLHNAIKDKLEKVQKKGKRARRESTLVFPGTKWCGKGSNSQNFEDLGEYSFADRCCR